MRIDSIDAAEVLALHEEWVRSDHARGARLSWWSLTPQIRAYLSGAYLSGAYLSGAYLSEADLSGADLSGADLSGADLRGAYLSEAYLSGADLSGAYLRGAYLSEADLSGAYLSGAYLRGAYLSEADLSGAYLSGKDAPKADATTVDRLIATGFLGDYYWTAFLMKDGSVLFRYGCEEHAIPEWRESLADLCEEHAPGEEAKYEARIGRLLDLLEAEVPAPLPPAGGPK